MSLLKDIEVSRGSATSDGGIICLEKNTNAWIMIDRNDMRICNKNDDCENGLDEQRNGKDCQRDDSEQPDSATREEEKPIIPPTKYDPTQSKPNPPTSKTNAPRSTSSKAKTPKPYESGPTVLIPITEKPKRTDETKDRVAADNSNDNKQEPKANTATT